MIRPLITILLLTGISSWLSAEETKVIRDPGEQAPYTLEKLLEAVVSHVLINNDNFLKKARTFYGTEGNATVVLTNTPWSIPWSHRFKPSIEGWAILADHEYEPPAIATIEGKLLDEQHKVNRMLGLRLNAIERDMTVPKAIHFIVKVSLFNAGGDKNGAVMGAHNLNYGCLYESGTWKVTFTGGSS
jgi:hypothetical protein